jgi:hypothetical protein
MPLVEGHWQRQQTPLRRLTQRERRLLVGFLVALALATAAAVAYAALHRATPLPAGCIEVTAPSTVGAVNVRVCGADAVARFCREQAGKEDPTARAAHARCRAYAARARS